MSRFMGWLIVCALLLSSTAAAQQNATVQGTVVDESGGVMPGVSVTAIDVATGRQSVAFTDETGRYRLDNLPPGQYRLDIQLVGFATAQVNGIELLVGANATVPPITLGLATLEEVVTVTTQAPLVDLTSSQVAGNIDRRQMEELPLQGRNWQELSLMVKGITANSVGNTPGASDGNFQLNLDGQQITQRVAGSGFGQPKVSREAIAEFQIITNMFDITQGRSTGMQVQAISRSGTNVMRASTYGFFRDDKLNAPDPIAGVVLPFQNQQAGGTVGGPIILNRAHFFASYEYEREPATAFLAPTRLPNQTFQFETKSINKNLLGRVDYQISPSDSVSARVQRWEFDNPFDISSGTAHPSTAEQLRQRSTNVAGTWTHVVSQDMILQVQGGYNGFSWFNDAIPSNDTQFYQTPYFVPQIQFPSLTLGGQRNYPNYTWQDTYSGRADITWNASNHDVRVGGEYLRVSDTKNWSLNRRGTYVFSTRPSDAELERRFPADAWNDPSRWDLSGLEGNLQRFDINFHPDYIVDIPRPTLGLWFGDNWTVTPNLSINMGVRYDADWGATNPPFVTDTEILIDNGIESGDFGYKTGIRDLNNVAPRAGFAWNVTGTGDLVIRGGSGLYYTTPVSNVTYSHQFYNRAIAATFLPTGPGFIENPTGGVTAEQYLSGAVAAPVQRLISFRRRTIALRVRCNRQPEHATRPRGATQPSWCFGAVDLVVSSGQMTPSLVGRVALLPARVLARCRSGEHEDLACVMLSALERLGRAPHGKGCGNGSLVLVRRRLLRVVHVVDHDVFRPHPDHLAVTPFHDRVAERLVPSARILCRLAEGPVDGCAVAEQGRDIYLF
jgi:hypothetical protein